MSVDIYRSRRTNYRVCKYWLPDDNMNRDKVILFKNPAGMFYATEANAINSNFNPIANAFGSNRNIVTLVTTDDVSDLKKNSIVLYLDKSWVVDDIQREIFKKATEFDNEMHSTTYIGIRR